MTLQSQLVQPDLRPEGARKMFQSLRSRLGFGLVTSVAFECTRARLDRMQTEGAVRSWRFFSRLVCTPTIDRTDMISVQMVSHEFIYTIRT